MASIVTFADGLRRIEFALTPNAPRRHVRLGRVSAKVAESWLARIEAIIGDKLARRAHDAETSAWLGKLDEKMLARLRKAGLAETTLGQFLERCFATMTAKPATRVFYSHTRRNLEAFFEPSRLVRTIGPAEADAWRAWLVETETLSAATVARRVIAARTFWRRGLRWKLVAENPFDGVKSGHQSNDARKMFVPRETIDRIIDATADLEWKVIIALARYGGLRTPSETFSLKWGDIDFDRGTIRVTCPKLAHIERCAHRVIPLFPELRKPLLDLFTEAETGSEHVIVRNRLDGLNLRTQFERILARAGAKNWPRLFHNLRASRETELMREYDLATVCKWIGNSPAVAATHYATSMDLDGDFKRASAMPENPPEKAQQKAQQSAAESPEPGLTADPSESSERPEHKRNVDQRQSCSSVGETRAWALLDSNQ